MRIMPFLYAVPVLSGCTLFAPSEPPYMVYFQERSTELDAPARRLIALAAKRASDQATAPVNVIGYTDSAGSQTADVKLAQQRAQTVADALAANGVAANRVVAEGRGQTGDDPGIASRRVEIIIRGG